MSFAVYFTGATASPLYFVYFVPVVVHAFHRDWNVILFSGFGGIVLYGVAVLVSMDKLSSAALADLLARLTFMLLTVAVACLALSVLRKEEKRDRVRTARLKAIAPHLPVVLVSGNEVTPAPGLFVAVLAKPYSRAAFADVIARFASNGDFEGVGVVEA